MEKMLYTVPEVAVMLRCNQERVRSLHSAGVLPFLRLGSLKCRKEALVDFLKRYEGYDVSDPENIVPLVFNGSE